MTKTEYAPPELQDQPIGGTSSALESAAGIVKKANSYVYEQPVIKTPQFPSITIAQQLVGPTLDTQSKKILSGFSFARQGSIVMGSVDGPGVAISKNGIVGKNSSGTTTFAIDATTGAATFLGTLKVGSTIEAGALVVGTNVGIGTAQTAAQVTTIVGNTVTTGYVNALNVTAQSVNASWVYAGNIQVSQIQAGTLSAGVVYAGNITAAQIVSGTITVGGTSQPSALIINQSSNDGNSRLRFQGGSRIWEDSSSRLGINSIANGNMYIYVNSNEKVVIPPGAGSQTSFRGGIYCDGNLNIPNGYTLRCQDYTAIQVVNFRLETGNRFVFQNNAGAEQFSIEPNGGGTTRINMNGYNLTLSSNKTAIVPTNDGYRALYCAEAPEVWFFDFCKDKKHIDPLFLEVTEGDMRFIKCDVGYQVWRRRKGHANLRFERKSYAQFIKNEAFLRMAK